MMSEFKKDQGIDLKNDKMALQRLKEAAEKAKIELSTAQETEINLPFVTADQSGPKHLQMKLTRAKFEQMVEDLVTRSIEPCKRALADAGLKTSDIDEVVLVGGSTRVPAIQKAVKDFFGKEPNRSVNPDEVVAVGAAVQGGVLTGDVKDVLLLDVSPLSLGIETAGGVRTVMIERNTTIPVKRSQIFSTYADNQPAVEINVLQGERKMAADNKSLGRFELLGIPPAPRGTPQIEVTFDIDANGILSVSAADKSTGKSQQIKITAQSGLSEEEIKRAVNEAEAHRREDEEKQEAASARNNLDNLVYQTEKLVKDAKDLDAGLKKTAEDEIAAAKKVLENREAPVVDLKAAFEKLQAASHTVSSEMYKKAGAAGAGTGNPQAEAQASSASGAKDDVIDADFKDVN